MSRVLYCLRHRTPPKLFPNAVVSPAKGSLRAPALREWGSVTMLGGPSTASERRVNTGCSPAARV
jgi:hypothetical protein